MTTRSLQLVWPSNQRRGESLLYDATGERVELSVATYANWVSKTANMLQDGLAAEPGAVRAGARLIDRRTADQPRRQ